jgi:hypothetical protein
VPKQVQVQVQVVMADVAVDMREGRPGAPASDRLDLPPRLECGRARPSETCANLGARLVLQP